MIAAFCTGITRANKYKKRSEHVGACSEERERPCGGAQRAALHSEHRRYHGFAMSTLNEEDRREYYRIEDTIALEINHLSGTHATHQTPAQDTSTLFNLLSELHVSEFESQHLLRQLGDNDRALGSYLKALNKRIDLLGQVVAHTVLGKIGEPQLVILSEGGVQFHHPLPIPAGTKLSIKMVLMPQALGLMMNAKVTHCDAREIGNFEIGTEFEDLPDAQRQLLARYILQRQSQQRRLAREQNNGSEA